jgi:hypothetical protein
MRFSKNRFLFVAKVAFAFSLLAGSLTASGLGVWFTIKAITTDDCFTPILFFALSGLFLRLATTYGHEDFIFGKEDA